jgi:hypothetical protein
VIQLTQDHVRQLVDLAGVLRDEADDCAKNKHWRAAVMLIAQSVEAGLVATVYCCETELRALHAWPAGPDSPPQQWPIGKLLGVARRAGWLAQGLHADTSPIDALSGEIGDAVAFLHEARNLAVHPGRAVVGGRDPGLDFTDDQSMVQTYWLLQGLSGAVFEKLTNVIDALPESKE